MKPQQLYLLYLFITLLLSTSCRQQLNSGPAKLTAEDSLWIATLRNQSIPYYEINQDSFAHYRLKIASKYKQADHLADWLSCYDTIIKAYRKHDQFDKSLFYYEQLYKSIWREPADSISLVTLAESNRQIAYYYYKSRNEYAKAISFYDEGINLMSKANGWDPESARLFYKAAGNCCSRLDDYAKAIIYLKSNVAVCRKFKDSVNLFKGLNDLGIPYNQVGQFSEAEKVFRESYLLAALYDSVEQEIDACSSLTDVFTQQQELDSAWKYNQRCFELMKSWQNKEPDSEGDVYRQQALIFTLQKKYSAAAASYSKAVALLLSSKEGLRRESGKVLGEFGSMYMEAGNNDKALEKFNESLHCLMPDYSSTDADDIPDSSLLYDENGLFISLEGRGDCYLHLFQKNGSKRNLALAAKNYSAAEQVESLRSANMENESSRLQFEKDRAELKVKQQTVDSLLQRYNAM